MIGFLTSQTQFPAFRPRISGANHARTYSQGEHNEHEERGAPAFHANALTAALRETVEAVGAKAMSLTQLAGLLKLAKSTTSERVDRALAGGWLVNDELRAGSPMKLRRGEPLPDPQKALPEVAALEARVSDALQQEAA